MTETFDTIHVAGGITVGDQNRTGVRLEIRSPLDGGSTRFVADAEGQVLVGGNRATGILILFPEGASQADATRATVRLNAESGLLELGVFDNGVTGVTIQLHARDALIRMGGHGVDGQLRLERQDGTPGVMFEAANGQGSLARLVLMDNNGAHQITLDGQGGQISAEAGRYREVILIDQGGKGRIGLDGNTATLRVGFQERAGHLILRSERGETVHLDGERAELEMGGTGKPGTGRLILKDPDGTPQITLSGQGGQVSAEEGRFREITLLDRGGKGRIGIDGETATLRVGFQDHAGHLILRSERGETVHLNGQGGNALLGGNGVDGDLLLFTAGVTATDEVTKATIHLDGQGGNARLGGNGVDGDLLLFAKGVTKTDDATQARIHLDAETGNLWLGGNGADGDLALFAKNTDLTGITNPAEKANLATIHLDGDAGDIILSNADCAEEFDVAEAELVEPGSVLVIASDSELRPCTQDYDKRVAGIVSGAGLYRPAIVLDRQRPSACRLPVALMGKVYCKVDAREHPIEVGDLLTSSATPGHAMKATDPVRATGAIIGKALKPLPTGMGLIPVLVTLQ